MPASELQGELRVSNPVRPGSIGAGDGTFDVIAKRKGRDPAAGPVGMSNSVRCAQFNLPCVEAIAIGISSTFNLVGQRNAIDVIAQLNGSKRSAQVHRMRSTDHLFVTFNRCRLESERRSRSAKLDRPDLLAVSVTDAKSSVKVCGIKQIGNPILCHAELDIECGRLNIRFRRVDWAVRGSSTVYRRADHYGGRE